MLCYDFSFGTHWHEHQFWRVQTTMDSLVCNEVKRHPVLGGWWCNEMLTCKATCLIQHWQFVFNSRTLWSINAVKQSLNRYQTGGPINALEQSFNWYLTIGPILWTCNLKFESKNYQVLNKKEGSTGELSICKEASAVQMHTDHTVASDCTGEVETWAVVFLIK